MGILITSIGYFLLFGCLAYILFEEKSKIERKKLGILEIHFERWIAIGFWIIYFFFFTFFTLGYYFNFFSNTFSNLNYLAISIIFMPLLVLAYFEERWKIILIDDIIIKYRLISKRFIKINEITNVKPYCFGYKYYIKNNKIFSTNARYHKDSRVFEKYVKEKINSNI